MAINRALMNRQMYNMGGSSLQAGAPDITLTGDMRPTYSAMRKQRLASGGIAGLKQIGKPGGLVEPGISKYGMFDFITEPLGKLKDKFIDDIIPNEIKENPLLTAAGGAALLNQFGLPDFLVPDFIAEGSNVGQNFLGDLISKIPGTPDYVDTVFGGTQGINPKDLIFGLPGDAYDILGEEGGDQRTYSDQLKDILLQQAGIPGNNQPSNQPTNLNSPGAQDQLALEQLKRRNLQADFAKAVAGGAAAGAFVNSQPKDKLPTDTTGINFQTAQQAMDDPNQRFKPPREATQLAAMGGRIGFSEGSKNYNEDPEYRGWKTMYEKNPDVGAMHDKHSEYLNFYNSQNKAQGKAEGGLMNLGGMEKDYREEGGFVPIGGREKADDVPARLSKNEFVFTADAVRNAGGGDIDQGAQVMERLMKSLEQGGQVSEESQGLEGAREMFETSQRLEKRII